MISINKTSITLLGFTGSLASIGNVSNFTVSVSLNI